ncbi:MAG TPA: polysaccharide deacetylase family protein [Bacteroidales bacterium]|nr:polysaccharide deacetylase family protein [Bacteroidales bacterium]
MIRSFLSKINFELHCNPVVSSSKEWKKYIPEQYKSVIMLSADFELAWAWQYSKLFKDPVREAKKLALRERENIPEILKICDKYNIPVTWATVGHLFLESCNNDNEKAHEKIPRLFHFENDYWKFSGNDWFENDPCSDYLKDPEWYAPDLIKLILNSEVKHEIACHTFSHIDCRDEVCTPELMRAELIECKRLAENWGLELRSFVHPGHTIGNLDVLSEEGFTNFRTNYNNILGFPVKHKNGLWELKQTAEIVFRKGWSIKYHIYRYITIIERALKSRTICVLWFHPSLDPIVVEEIFPEVFSFLNKNRDKIWITTHSEYVTWLERTSSSSI